jgi:hypothetical protein
MSGVGCERAAATRSVRPYAARQYPSMKDATLRSTPSQAHGTSDNPEQAQRRDQPDSATGTPTLVGTAPLACDRTAVAGVLLRR